MKFGIFDHVDKSHLPLAEQYKKRIEYVQAAEKAGFYGYHVAEHHATPLNLVPVPGVFLGALAQATSKIRLGPLVYLLPLYSPLRLIEEIAILDHLSNGRLDVGVGRGVSPFELNYHNINAETSREVFLDALDAVVYGLTHETLDHDGKYYQYKNVPMELKPLQKPYPPIWYPSSSPSSAAYSGEKGYSFSTLGAVKDAKACVDAFKANYKQSDASAAIANDFPGGAAIGVNRHVVIAETDEKALEIAGPAYKQWHSSLTKLWRENQVEGPSFARLTISDVSHAMDAGSYIVGSPETVRGIIESQVAELGVNYFIADFYFGDIAHEDAMTSLDLFKKHVMPAF